MVQGAQAGSCPEGIQAPTHQFMSMTKARILMAEDAAAPADDLVRSLSSLGYEMAGRVRDVSAVLPLACQTHPDLVLLHAAVGPGGQAGSLAAAYQIREQCDLPILYVANSANASALSHLLASSPFGLLHQSGEPWQLQHDIEVALHHHSVERRLRESEQRYRGLVDGVPVGLYRTTPAGQIVDANPALVRMLGFPNHEALLGTNANAIFVDPAERQQQQNDLACTSGAQVYEIRLRRHDGTSLWVKDSVHAVCDDAGQVLFNEGSLEDITERKEAHQAVTASEEHHRRLVELSPDAVFVETGGRFAYINPAGLRLLGASSPDDILGRDVLELAHPHFRSLLMNRLNRLNVERREVLPVEAKYLRLDGSSIDVELAAIPFIYQGQPGAQVIMHSISERKQRERELEAIVTVANALRAAATRDQMLPIILDQVIALVGSQAALITQPNPATLEVTGVLGRAAWSSWTGLRLPKIDGEAWDFMASSEAAIFNDALTDPRFYHFARAGEGWSVACAPLRAEAATIGALWVGRHTKITAADLRLLTAISDMAANAMHRAALHEQTRDRLAHLDALHTVDMAISSSLDLRITLDVLLDQVTAQLHVDAADILLLRPQTRMLEMAAGRGFRLQAAHGVQLKLGQGFAGQAALQRQTVACADLRAEAAQSGGASGLLAEGFVSLYCVPLIAKGAVLGVLEVFRRSHLVPDQEWLDFLGALAKQAAIAVDNATLFENLERSHAELALAYDNTLEGWSRALDLRDRETEGHTQRVATIAVGLARAMAVPEADLVHIRRGALLHDIGKMGIPDSILLKPGPLTPEEWAVMRRHPEYAFELLSPVSFLRPALDVPYAHHEKWDGTGYPRGLKGGEIPLAARIFAVVDVWDALISDRPYRPAWSADRARAYIAEQAGRHFDPAVAAASLVLLADA
jgi:PAS domain S-box-containing protein/putative nucleotidyltransferase with HDIG domain